MLEIHAKTVGILAHVGKCSAGRCAAINVAAPVIPPVPSRWREARVGDVCSVSLAVNETARGTTRIRYYRRTLPSLAITSMAGRPSSER